MKLRGRDIAVAAHDALEGGALPDGQETNGAVIAAKGVVLLAWRFEPDDLGREMRARRGVGGGQSDHGIACDDRLAPTDEASRHLMAGRNVAGDGQVLGIDPDPGGQPGAGDHDVVPGANADHRTKRGCACLAVSSNCCSRLIGQ